MIRNIIFVIGLMIIGASNTGALNLTTDVYPSEEELYEAYLSGDISYETYLNLVELIESGIDSSHIHLLEELPGIGFVVPWLPDSISTENEQVISYMRKEPDDELSHGMFKIRNARRLEDSHEYKTYYYLNSNMNEEWRVESKFNRDYDGNYQWTARAIEFSPRRGSLTKARFGTSRIRFAHGLNIGYRGRLLSKGDDVSDESILFPAHGGFNGVYLENKSGNNTGRWLYHYDQNLMHRFQVGAALLETKYKRIRAMVMGQYGMLGNRLNSKKYKYYQIGSALEYDMYDYNFSGEIAIQQHTQNLVGAILVNGAAYLTSVRVQVSGWHYADDFINFAGGGQSGNLYQSVAIDSLEFKVSDRRTGQDGVRLKSDFSLSNTWKATAAVASYGFNQDDKKAEVYTALQYDLNGKSSLKLDYQHKWNYDYGLVDSENEYRMEYKLKNGGHYLRSYIGYRNDRSNDEYMMIFMRSSKEFASFGQLEFWCNLDRINLNTGQLDYLYMYISENVPIRNFLYMSGKLTYRFSRSYSDKELATFYLEGKVQW